METSRRCVLKGLTAISLSPLLPSLGVVGDRVKHDYLARVEPRLYYYMKTFRLTANLHRLVLVICDPITNGLAMETLDAAPVTDGEAVFTDLPPGDIEVRVVADLGFLPRSITLLERKMVGLRHGDTLTIGNLTLEMD